MLETTDQENREYYYGPEGGESVRENGGIVFTERSEYSYGDGVVTVNSHIENFHSSGSSDSWDNEETFEINEYGRKL